LPRSIDAHIDRGLNQRLDTQTDTLGTGAGLRFSALNMFGAFGVKPLLKIYENDEYNTSFSAALAFPRDKHPSWRFQAGQIFIFYGFEGAMLQFEDIIIVPSKGWMGTFKLNLICPPKNPCWEPYTTGFFQNSADKAHGLH
jgi:hypothetical protein